jgi:hypothetical protein
LADQVPKKQGTPMKMAFKLKEKKLVPIKTTNWFSKLETKEEEDSNSGAMVTDHPKRRSTKGVKTAPMKGIKTVLTKKTKTVKKRSWKGPVQEAQYTDGRRIKPAKHKEDKETIRGLIKKYGPRRVHLRIDVKSNLMEEELEELKTIGKGRTTV